MSDQPPQRNDIGLFIDFAVFPRVDGRVEVQNKIDGTCKTFDDITSAVDYAAARTHTLSPVYPAGYRSRTVRLFELLEVHGLRGLFETEGESIEITNAPPAEPEEQGEPRLVSMRRTAQQYLLHSLEADGEIEARAWLERSRDIHSAADELERRYAAPDSEERKNDRRNDTDPWRHQSGRVSRLDRRERKFA